MKNNKPTVLRGILAGTFVTMAALGLTTRAGAVPTMTISDGINPVITIVDGGAGDNNPIDGVVGFNGSVGQWVLAAGVGQTKPYVGSATSPHLDLTYVVTSTGAGNITIQWSDTDFTAGSAGFAMEIGGTTAGNATFDTYADTGNTLFGTSLHLSSLSFSTSPFSGTASAGAVGSSPFSITEQIVINHGEGTTSDSGNVILTTVPDGGATVLLLGVSLAGMALIGRPHKYS